MSRSLRYVFTGYPQNVTPSQICLLYTSNSEPVFRHDLLLLPFLNKHLLQARLFEISQLLQLTLMKGDEVVEVFK